MKLGLATLFTAFAATSAFKRKSLSKTAALAKTAMEGDIKATSKLGRDLMSKARKLDDGNNNNNNNDEDFEPLWVADYSIKFQGCHHISQWNEEADGEEDVKVQTKRLVRFRLCPTDACTTESGAGCSSEYGEYVIDMNIYLEAYMQSVMAYWEYQCELLEEGDCACENANDEEICQWDCFVEKGVEEYCADENPYNQDNGEEEVEFELEEFMYCANFDFPDQNNRRKLNGGDEIEYFVGPYCSSQGGSINLGLFMDETCTTFADDEGGTSTFYQGTGIPLPYSSENIINMDCLSCKEPVEDDENNDGNDNEDEDEVTEMCEEMYRSAGKCEEGLYDVISSAGGYVNNNACNYMEGIKIIRMDGSVQSGGLGGANKTASIFIGIFAVAFVLLAAYVYYLKTKLDRASINLAE